MTVCSRRRTPTGMPATSPIPCSTSCGAEYSIKTTRSKSRTSSNYLAKAFNKRAFEAIYIYIYCWRGFPRSSPLRNMIYIYIYIKYNDAHFRRHDLKYMPGDLKFRRPQPPWNKFSINTRSEVDGGKDPGLRGQLAGYLPELEAWYSLYPGFH